MGKSREREMQQAYEEALRGLAGQEEILGQYNTLGSAGKNQLQDYYGQIQQDIGQQFNPAMRMAQARLAGSPLLADSGYANRLNRQLQQGAFTDLSSRYGNAANEQAGGNLAALRQMLAQRNEQRAGLTGQYFGGRMQYANRPKTNLWSTLGQVGGTVLGTALGRRSPAGGGVGGYQANDAYYA